MWFLLWYSVTPEWIISSSNCGSSRRSEKLELLALGECVHVVSLAFDLQHRLLRSFRICHAESRASMVTQMVNLQCWRPGFDPWVRKIPWRREWQPTPVFLPGEFYGHRHLVDYSPWDCRVGYNWTTFTCNLGLSHNFSRAWKDPGASRWVFELLRRHISQGTSAQTASHSHVQAPCIDTRLVKNDPEGL